MEKSNCEWKWVYRSDKIFTYLAGGSPYHQFLRNKSTGCTLIITILINQFTGFQGTGLYGY